MRIALVLVATALLAAIAGGAVIYGGVYNIAATDQHLAPTYWMLKAAMRRSVAVRARKVDVPGLADESLVRRGLGLYREQCLRCHGAPGVAPDAFALGMTPVPENLALAGKEWQAADIFWAVKKGIKMTGMPAWQYRLSDEELWAVVAFVKALPSLSPEQYRALEPLPAPDARPEELPAPDPQRGVQAINQYACITCHVIPGIVGARAPVGPTLEGMAMRTFIAGVLPNDFDNMVRWLRVPQEVKPGNAMPDLGLSTRDARDIAAYLWTLN